MKLIKVRIAKEEEEKIKEEETIEQKGDKLLCANCGKEISPSNTTYRFKKDSARVCEECYNKKFPPSNEKRENEQVSKGTLKRVVVIIVIIVGMILIWNSCSQTGHSSGPQIASKSGLVQEIQTSVSTPTKADICKETAMKLLPNEVTAKRLSHFVYAYKLDVDEEMWVGCRSSCKSDWVCNPVDGYDCTSTFFDFRGADNTGENVNRLYGSVGITLEYHDYKITDSAGNILGENHIVFNADVNLGPEGIEKRDTFTAPITNAKLVQCQIDVPDKIRT